MLKSRQIKKQQVMTLAVVAGAAVVVAIAFLYLTASSTKKKVHDDSAFEKIELINPADKVDQESIWIEETQTQLKSSQAQREQLQHQLADLSQAHETASDSQAQLQSQVRELTQDIAQLKKQLEASKEPKKSSVAEHGAKKSFAQLKGRGFPGNASMKPGATPMQPTQLSVMTHLHVDHVALEEDTSDEKTVENFVPSGSFAKAVLLSGADASAAVNSQTNPDPMLFRIVDNGTLPNDAQSHLKDCVLTSAVTGDISSERGKIRFERMSCTQENGEVLEVPVEGYVAGSDGKNGIRGNPVWREGALTERAFFAGTLSGFSSALSDQYTTTSTSALGSTESVNNGDSLRFGFANGMSSAADRLSKYYIERAEQYHPVIQIGPGIVVDVVFLKGFYIDGKSHKARAAKEEKTTKRPQQSVQQQAQQAAMHIMQQLPQNPNQ